MAHWLYITELQEIPMLGSRVVTTANGDIALFRTGDNQVFALRDACPHRRGPLSQGIVHGQVVTCPLHSWKIDLTNGVALPPDEGCTQRYAVQVKDNGQVWLDLTPMAGECAA